MKKHNGFTLIELMITLAVLGILVVIAIPSFSDFLSSNRMVTTTNSISAGVQAARSEAIIRKVPVIFCQNDGSGTGCAASMASLAAGWVIGTDDEPDGTINTVIRVADAFPSGMQFTLAGFNNNFLRFNTSGISTNVTQPTTIRICDSNRTGEQGNDIYINGTGGVSVSANKPTCP